MMRELKKKNDTLSHEKHKIAKELQQVLSRKVSSAKEQLIIDTLTGVYTHAYFLKRLQEEFGRAQRYQTPLSLVLIGVDGFANIKDKLGEEAVNYILIKIANHLLSQTRTSDVLARSEKDNFLIILPHTGESGVQKESQRLLNSMDGMTFLDEEMLKTLNVPKRRLNDYTRRSVNIVTISYPSNELVVDSAESFYKALCRKMQQAT